LNSRCGGNRARAASPTLIGVRRTAREAVHASPAKLTTELANRAEFAAFLTRQQKCDPVRAAGWVWLNVRGSDLHGRRRGMGAGEGDGSGAAVEDNPLAGA
jgi:hypothetical protein